jgi:hypothetical protein
MGLQISTREPPGETTLDRRRRKQEAGRISAGAVRRIWRAHGTRLLIPD